MFYKNFHTVIQKSNFDFLYIIGKGGFGKVWKVYSKKVGKVFALKEMSKAKIIIKLLTTNIYFEFKYFDASFVKMANFIKQEAKSGKL